MKIHTNTYRFLTFLIVLIFCAIPPVFTTSNDLSLFVEWDFPFQQICLAVFAGFLLYFSRELLQNNNTEFYFSHVKILIISISTFIILVVTAFIFQKLSELFNVTPAIEILKPDSIPTLFFCIINFLCSAFYEEVIYRFFLPECMVSLLKKIIPNEKIRIHVCDAVCMILFALGHLYLGVFSVINASFAYIILRLCFKFSKNIFTGTAAHFAYNLFQLFISPL